MESEEKHKKGEILEAGLRNDSKLGPTLGNDDEFEEFNVYDADGNLTVKNTRAIQLEVEYCLSKKNYLNIPNRMKPSEEQPESKEEAVEGATQEMGINGLRNLGNTCYINSSLVCLFQVQPLCDYFLNDLHLQEVNELNPLGSNGVVSSAFASLVKYDTITVIE